MDKRNLLLIFYITFSVISFYHFQIVKNLYEINKVCLHVIKSTIFFEFQRPSTAATTFGSRIIHKDRKMDLDSDSEDENAEREALADLNDLKAIRKEEDFKPVEGMPGMYYKVRDTTVYNLLALLKYITNYFHFLEINMFPLPQFFYAGMCIIYH